ncbi:hypothetical protein XH92_37440 [Bradyrhizobium sp. CCBAU 53421]|nr:hypothetical protein XH92_37440 [Bradyrhizobium sp. CCBAU 53421]
MPSPHTDDRVQAQRVGYYLLPVDVENALLVSDLSISWSQRSKLFNYTLWPTYALRLIFQQAYNVGSAIIQEQIFHPRRLEQSLREAIAREHDSACA